MGDANAGTKVGMSQAEGILVVAYGDASISAAMKDGNLTRVHHVDKETFDVLGIYARYQDDRLRRMTRGRRNSRDAFVNHDRFGPAKG